MERIAVMMTDMNYGGVETVIMNYYRRIDKNEIQFDFFALEGSKLPQKEEIEEAGGRVYIVPRYTKPWKYCKKVYDIFKHNKYKIVHSNMNTLSFFPLYTAKKAGIPVRIAHNHSTAAKGETKKNLLKYMLRSLAKKYATDYMACSVQAAEWMFGKKAVDEGLVYIVNNAIEVENFTYSVSKRNDIRAKYAVQEDEILLGCIGRLCFQKNQEFLLRLLAKLNNESDCSGSVKLMLIGDGENRDRLIALIRELKLDNQVIMVPACDNVNDYYSAFDIFVLPSRYEGFGMVAVEAQVSGLPCLLSDKFPEDVVIGTNVDRVELNEERWFDKLKAYVDEGDKLTGHNKLDFDKRTCDINLFSDYDVKVQAGKLQEYYEDKSSSFCVK